LLGKHTNTYTFSKSLSEYLIHLEHQNLPVSVVRPSVTIASIKDPFPGWIDNFAGTTFFMMMIGKGLMKQILGDYQSNASFVPVDIVANATIAAAWETALTPKPNVPKIYHACTGAYNDLNFGTLFKDMCEMSRRYPFEGAVWYPTVKLIKNFPLKQIYSGITEYLPAYMIDSVHTIFGKKPKYFFKYQSKCL
jgi:nucleoside-diphosphate-sugar epimerase